MRRFVFAMSALAFVMAGSSDTLAQSSRKSREPEWQTITSDTFAYKATFPGKPKDFAKRHDTRLGDLLVSTWSLESKDAVYAVTATKYSDKFAEADSKKLFAAAKDALSANGGKIVTDERIAITGPDEIKIEGRDVTVEFGKTQIRTRIALHGLTLYQVSVTGKKDAVNNEVAKKFIAAFEVTRETK
jgi:hypothetical protein